ncbi:MAG: hydrogenase 3 maturation endopeptidase HyCI [Candidatus Omnitrophica bacterium]|nr:hydrogenase 3 maturation endopeptidase HyCI [Candidatus Omnitrophota bacterium]
MSSINASLQRVLSFNSRPSVIITIGNSLRSDDGLGPYIAERILPLKDILVIDAAQNPERIIDQVVAFRPKSIVIIDAADFAGEPGEIRIIRQDDVPQTSLSTHSIPLSVIGGILIADTKASLEFIAVQVKNVVLGQGLSAEVKDSADKIIAIINKQGGHYA